MRHYRKGRKLGTDASHTKAMKKNLAVALFTNDRIKTTVPRAKEMRPLVEKIITWAKKGDLHSRRLAIAALGDKELVREVFAKAEQGMWADRDGGYTRIIKLGPRKGDNAPMCIIEIVAEAVGGKPAPAAKKSTGGSKTHAATGGVADGGEELSEEAEASEEGGEAEEGDDAEGSEAEAEEATEAEVEEATEAEEAAEGGEAEEGDDAEGSEAEAEEAEEGGEAEEAEEAPEEGDGE